MEQNEAVAASIANVTAIQTAEKKRQENYMRLLLDNNPNVILLLNKTGNIVYCTKEVLTLAGLTNFTAINGKHFRECFLRFAEKDVVGELETQIERASETGEFFKREITLQTQDGEIHRCILHFITDDKTGKDFDGSAIIMYDITAIRQMQEDAEQARQQAVLASAAKSTFLSNMSHEIRTPMNAIIGMTAIARSSDEIIKKDYCLNKINEASTLLLGIINDILDMSKIEANKLEIVNQEFELEHFLSQVINIINFRVEEKEQQFSVFVDKHLPKIIDSDEQRLSQVLTNLLSNAAKFTPEHGSISLTMKLLDEKDEQCLIQFNISDTGIGLTEEQQSRLFSSFEQADKSTSRKFGGTGLGLAISKRIVEMLGGTIWVTSQIGHGASFGFTIRCKRKSFDNANIDRCIAGSRKKIPLDIKGIFEGKTILIAEDVKVNREIIKAQLAETKVDIDFAVDGRSAISIFSAASSKYDMIFMDMQMPEVDGIEATASIRKLNIPEAEKIPIVAMTANVFKEDIDKCIAAGMNDHVGKPLDIQIVIDKMKRYIL
ncbi:hypothetical protein FACS189427_02970 [Planctomycetales bacterium]|nr:hypothetical protein FACS189427_02970 [Planctomycetales bacterium]